MTKTEEIRELRADNLRYSIKLEKAINVIVRLTRRIEALEQKERLK